MWEEFAWYRTSASVNRAKRLNVHLALVLLHRPETGRDAEQAGMGFRHVQEEPGDPGRGIPEHLLAILEVLAHLAAVRKWASRSAVARAVLSKAITAKAMAAVAWPTP